MTVGILFAENYIAGGTDQVANTLIRMLPFSRLTVMVNRADDTRILLAGEIPSYVTVERYGLMTIPELSSAARRRTGTLLRPLSRALSLLVRYPLFFFSIFYFMWRIRRTGASVFIANNGGYPGGYYCRSASIAAWLLPGVKVFHVVHGMAVSPPRAVALVEWLVDRAIDRGCRIITVCRSAGIRLKATRSIKQDTTVIYNGLTARPWQSLGEKTGNELRILNVGYFDHNKNQEMLIHALAELVRRGMGNFKATFVGASTGDGTFERCRSLAVDFGLADRVQFLGFVEDMAPQYDAADLLVLCSRSEGLPISILEAMRAGRAVVATGVGGISELVRDGENGYVIPVDDHLTLADKLERFARDRRLLVCYGAAGRMFYEQQFNAEWMVARYAQIFGLNSETGAG